MSVSGGKLSPSVGQIPGGTNERAAVVLEYRSSLAPDADVGIVPLDEFHECVVVVVLVGPHAVVDVPVQYPQAALLAVGAGDEVDLDFVQVEAVGDAGVCGIACDVEAGGVGKVLGGNLAGMPFFL